MEPAIPHGAQIKVRATDADNCRVGQVVACICGDSLVAHRLVYCGRSGRTRAYILTQGDGRLVCDRPIRKSAILGVVTAFCANGTWQIPAGCASRPSWQQALATIHMQTIKICLTINYAFASRVSALTLMFGFAGKGLWARLRVHFKMKL